MKKSYLNYKNVLAVLFILLSMITLVSCKDNTGPKGDTGPQGETGQKGEDGKGISDIEILVDRVIITYSDGTKEEISIPEYEEKYVTLTMTVSLDNGYTQTYDSPFVKGESLFEQLITEDYVAEEFGLIDKIYIDGNLITEDIVITEECDLLIFINNDFNKNSELYKEITGYLDDYSTYLSHTIKTLISEIRQLQRDVYFVSEYEEAITSVENRLEEIKSNYKEIAKISVLEYVNSYITSYNTTNAEILKQKINDANALIDEAQSFEEAFDIYKEVENSFYTGFESATEDVFTKTKKIYSQVCSLVSNISSRIQTPEVVLEIYRDLLEKNIEILTSTSLEELETIKESLFVKEYDITKNSNIILGSFIKNYFTFDEEIETYIEEVFSVDLEQLLTKSDNDLLKGIFDYFKKIYIAIINQYPIIRNAKYIYNSLISTATQESIEQLTEIYNTFKTETLDNLEIKVYSAEEQTQVNEKLSEFIELLENAYVADPVKIYELQIKELKSVANQLHQELVDYMNGYPKDAVEERIEQATTVELVELIIQDLEVLYDYMKAYSVYDFYTALYCQRLDQITNFGLEKYGVNLLNYYNEEDYQINGTSYYSFVYEVENAVDETYLLYSKEYIQNTLRVYNPGYDVFIEEIEAVESLEELDALKASPKYIFITGYYIDEYNNLYNQYTTLYNEYYQLPLPLTQYSSFLEECYTHYDYLQEVNIYEFDLTYHEEFMAKLNEKVVSIQKDIDDYNALEPIKEELKEGLDPNDYNDSEVIRMIDSAKTLEELESIRNGKEYLFVTGYYIEEYINLWNEYSDWYNLAHELDIATNTDSDNCIRYGEYNVGTINIYDFDLDAHNALMDEMRSEIARLKLLVEEAQLVA